MHRLLEHDDLLLLLRLLDVNDLLGLLLRSNNLGDRLISVIHLNIFGWLGIDFVGLLFLIHSFLDVHGDIDENGDYETNQDLEVRHPDLILNLGSHTIECSICNIITWFLISNTSQKTFNGVRDSEGQDSEGSLQEFSAVSTAFLIPLDFLFLLISFTINAGDIFSADVVELTEGENNGDHEAGENCEEHDEQLVRIHGSDFLLCINQFFQVLSRLYFPLEEISVEESVKRSGAVGAVNELGIQNSVSREKIGLRHIEVSRFKSFIYFAICFRYGGIFHQ